MHFVNIEECIEENDPDALADDDDTESSMSMDFSVPNPGIRKKPSDSPSSTAPTVEAAASLKANATATTVVPELFRIPELPRGQHLVFNILSTWGDPFYVGLMGIELFDHTGHSVYLSDVDQQLSADPADLNVLDHGDRVDPRTVDKLVDGHYFTCDELHAWLVPFTRGQNHFVYFDLDYPLALSMIRVWNYNTTRIHSYRGARYVEVSLDGKPIFKGEIRRAPGSVLEDVDVCHECILFTTNASILHLIEKYDKQQQQGVSSGARHLSSSGADVGCDWVDARALERPKTGNRAGRAAARGSGLHLSVATGGEMAATTVCAPVTPLPKGLKMALDASPPPLRPCTAPIALDQMVNERPLCCQKVTTVLEANWGDPYEIGIAGIEFLDGSYAPLRMDAALVSSNGGAHSPDDASAQFERLVRSHGARHLSIDPREMWCVRLQDALGSSRALSVDFGAKTTLRALKVWNYNTTLEDSFKGAKQLTVFVDGALHARFSLRKAPGNLTLASSSTSAASRSSKLVERPRRWGSHRRSRTDRATQQPKSSRSSSQQHFPASIHPTWTEKAAISSRASLPIDRARHPLVVRRLVGRRAARCRRRSPCGRSRSCSSSTRRRSSRRATSSSSCSCLRGATSTTLGSTALSCTTATTA